MVLRWILNFLLAHVYSSFKTTIPHFLTIACKKKALKLMLFIREIMLIKDMDTVAETAERWPKTSWGEN